MKEPTGAAVMPESSKYPVAPATMQPMSRPMMTLVDFMIGEPNRSQKMMVMKTRNPRPMYSALPQGRA